MAVAALRGFWRTGPARRRLALEAALALLRARWLTLGPAARFTRALGRLQPDREARPGANPVPQPGPAAAAALAEARRVSAMVDAVARHLPLRALCLEQAIAIRAMLARRGVPVVVTLGVARTAGGRRSADRAAHAWVDVAGQTVAGEVGRDAYIPVARFG